MTSWGKDALRDREIFEKWRPKMLGVQNYILNQGFWSDVTPALDDGLKFIRILVVGNTGVGKSTLINRVFGISPSGEHPDVLVSCLNGRNHSVPLTKQAGRREDL